MIAAANPVVDISAPAVADPTGHLLATIIAGDPTRDLAPLALPVGMLALAGLSEVQVAATLGCSPAGARRVHAALALHRHLLAATQPERIACQAPERVAAFLRPFAQRDVERLWALPLDPRCNLIGREPIVVSSGDVDGTDAGPRAFIRAALRAGAVSVIAAHNHPSGDPTPSAADLAVTRRLVAAGRAIDIAVVDHVIVTAAGSWFSLRSEHPEVFR